jgi:hypothetical protein
VVLLHCRKENLLTHTVTYSARLNDSITAQSEYPIDLDFLVTEAYENINAFMEVYQETPPVPKRGVGEYQYAPMPEPKHIRDLDVYDNRNYVLRTDEVHQVTATHPDYASDHEYYPGGHITYWRLRAYDTNNPDEVLDLFQQPAHGTRPILEQQRSRTKSGKPKTVVIYGDPRIPEMGAITTVFCSSQEDAVTLGNIVCDLLNRMPANVDWATTKGKVTRFSSMRIFVERTALVLWRSKFDFRQLPHDFFPPGDGKQNAHYGTYIDLRTSDDGKVHETQLTDFALRVSLMGWCTDDSPLNMDVTGCDDDLVGADKVEACPEGFHLITKYTDEVYGADEQERNTADALARKTRIEAARRIFDKTLYDMCGLIGSGVALRRMVRDRTGFGSKNLEVVTEKTALVSDGLLDARNILGMMKGEGGKHAKTLQISITRTIASIFTNAEALILLKIQLHSLHRLDVTYVKEQFLQALRDGKTLIQAIFAAFVAADRVNLRMIPLEDIRLSLSASAREAPRSFTELVCFACSGIKLSSSMVLSDDGGVYDKRCFAKKDSLRATKMTVESCFLLRKSIWHDPNADVEAILRKMVQDFMLLDGVSYKCAYDATVEDAFTSIQKYGIRTYLDSPSLEKPLQATQYLGKTVLHAPNNAVVCRSIFNRLKYCSIVAFMGWPAELLHLRDLIKHKPVQVGYDEEVADALEAFDAFTDNSYLTSMKLPFFNTARAELQLSANKWRALEKESRSGVWDGNLPDRKNHRGKSPLWRISTQRDSVGGGEEGPDWNDDTIEVLKKDIHEMQHGPNKHKFSPHGLTLPTNTDGSPCLWRPAVLPPDVNWKWLNTFMRAKLYMWRNACNKGRPTNESAATLLLLYVLWWLRTGGKCHVFGFHMTPWPHYDSVSSIGRGVYLLDDEGRATDVEIVAGTALTSGFLCLLPTDVNDPQQFDWKKMTAMVESWKANVARYHYPVAVYPEMWARYRLISPSKPGLYEARKTLAEYTRHPLPRPPRIVELPEDADDDVDEEAQMFEEEDNSREAPAGEDQFALEVAEDEHEGGAGGNVGGVDEGDVGEGGVDEGPSALPTGMFLYICDS